MRFFVTFLVTMGIAVAINAVPYLMTRGAHQRDGQQAAGFPFEFHKMGGDCYPAECDGYFFHVGYFAADIAIALTCAIMMGFMVASLGKSRRSKTKQMHS